MTVLGVGTDLVQVANQPPLDRAFTGAEKRRAARRAASQGTDPALHLAAVWAIKEAVVKAWSGALYGKPPPLGRDELDWTHIQVVHDRWGRPGVVLAKDLHATVAASLGTDFELHVSASHDGDYALANCVLVSKASSASSSTSMPPTA